MEMCAFIGKSHEFFMNLKKAGTKIKKNVANADFEKLMEFEITIPENFDFDAFRFENKKGFWYSEPALIGKNFKSNISSEVGKKKIVEIYQPKRKKTSEDCLNFIAGQNGQLPNVQGLAMVWQQAKEKLPQEIWIIGFDQKENLFRDSGGRYRMPNLYQFSDGDWYFHLGYFERDCSADHCVLFFRDCA
jgi:hypothetical protein